MKEVAPATPFEIIPPDDTPEILWPAYFSCFLWAVTFDPILQRFLGDTGISIPKLPSPFEQMIDKSTGFNPYDKFIRAFVPWFNTNVWGKMDGDDEVSVDHV